MSTFTIGSPARAGIGPLSNGDVQLDQGFPRASGDRPTAGNLLAFAAKVPPRERG